MDKKHLTLQDINIGDYVQEWSEIPGKWSMPMYVDGIFADGDLYLNFDENEADPWETNVKDVYDIPIDWGILQHFGFFESDTHLFHIEQGDWRLSVKVTKPFDFFQTVAVLSNKKERKAAIPNISLNSIRALQHFFYERTGEPLKLNFE